eukprot:gnl/TRDRNA2_/TRDRNA2_185513_c0_seq1.p1 gnl/TRDRNA2_/TRDRNA2_185513_c0~~gnl/TRDRNA2_/TRDRNA2_185513_c0_seq1.p1  ORF type:complete len:231 (-),score=57.80 gnl/TRDRNA2_/TRDRNA2_185513_c0_seq1:90-782(-)
MSAQKPRGSRRKVAEDAEETPVPNEKGRKRKSLSLGTDIKEQKPETSRRLHGKTAWRKNISEVKKVDEVDATTCDNSRCSKCSSQAEQLVVCEKCGVRVCEACLLKLNLISPHVMRVPIISEMVSMDARAAWQHKHKVYDWLTESKAPKPSVIRTTGYVSVLNRRRLADEAWDAMPAEEKRLYEQDELLVEMRKQQSAHDAAILQNEKLRKECELFAADGRYRDGPKLST